MIYFFDSQENLKKLQGVLNSWKGTPFAFNSGVKHEGVDCSHLIACVLEEVGARSDLVVPYYPEGWYKNRNDDRLEKGVISLGGDRISSDSIRDGDIVLMQLGRSFAHGGFFLHDCFWHVMWKMRVRPEYWDSKSIKRRKKYGFRVWAEK